MVYRLALLSLLSMGLIASPALAQSDPAAKAPTNGKKLSEVSWTKAGTYQWDRPASVRYVLVRACGGGGGGGGSYSLFPKPAPREDGGTAAGGGGGAGSPVATILLGPLSASRYTIVVGQGGTGGASTSAAKMSVTLPAGTRGESGTATSFTGPDLSFETPGAPGGGVGQPQTRFGAEANVYEYSVLPARSSGGAYPGGGAAQNGARGLLGVGGGGNTRGNSGGGGGSLGNGGAAGDIDSAGADGGTCAGGGGAGYLQHDQTKSNGGHGGDGGLTLLSLIAAQAPEQ